MYTNDKITKKMEVKESGKVTLNHPFYVFLLPKSEAAGVAVITAKLCHDTAESDCPFVPNEWNPLSVSELNVTSTIIQNYRVFVGGEE